jgi:hypothetical protein
MPNDLQTLQSLCEALELPKSEVQRLLESCRLLPVGDNEDGPLYDRYTLARLRDERNRKVASMC